MSSQKIFQCVSIKSAKNKRRHCPLRAVSSAIINTSKEQDSKTESETETDSHRVVAHFIYDNNNNKNK